MNSKSTHPFAFILAVGFALSSMSVCFGQAAPKPLTQKPLTQQQMKAFYKKACQYWHLKKIGASQAKIDKVLAEVKEYDDYSWKGLRDAFLKPFAGPKKSKKTKKTELRNPPIGLEKCWYIIQAPGSHSRRKPSPLCIALHGGSRGVGNPGQAISLMGNPFKSKGCILAAPKVPPNAVFAEPISAKFVKEIIWEVSMDYNVDLDRIYCAGHSLGGVGAWYMPLVMPDLIAGTATAAGNPAAVVDYEFLLNTPIYAVHGSTDIQVSPDANRAAAAAIKAIPDENKIKDNYVYREITTKDGRGHGLPAPVVMDMRDWVMKKKREFAPKRVICVCPHIRNKGEEIHPYAQSFWLAIKSHGFRSKADGKIIGPNELKITFSGSGQLIVFFSDDFMDLNKPVKVHMNGRLVLNRIVPRSAKFLLEHIEETRDRGRVYANSVVVSGN